MEIFKDKSFLPIPQAPPSATFPIQRHNSTRFNEELASFFLTFITKHLQWYSMFNRPKGQLIREVHC